MNLMFEYKMLKMAISRLTIHSTMTEFQHVSVYKLSIVKRQERGTDAVNDDGSLYDITFVSAEAAYHTASVLS
jgi:hypothetical protein